MIIFDSRTFLFSILLSSVLLRSIDRSIDQLIDWFDDWMCVTSTCLILFFPTFYLDCCLWLIASRHFRITELIMDAFPELGVLFEQLRLALYGDATRTLTENAAGAWTTTGDKCLDFFATIVRDTSIPAVLKDFIDAWNEDPEKAIKLLLNLRDIRGGKGEKKLALVLMYVLSCWKPLTYLANLERFLKVYFTKKFSGSLCSVWKWRYASNVAWLINSWIDRLIDRLTDWCCALFVLFQVGCYKDLLFISELASRSTDKSLQRIAQMNEGPIELKIMACQLLNDEKDLQASEKASISLCAKWAPTENTHFDRKPLRFSHKISTALGLKKGEYRKRLSKLRAHLGVLERLMATGKWDEIVFKSLPSKAHRLNRKAFKREENCKKVKSDDRVALALRYTEYLAQLAAGKTSIKSTGTEPHDLVRTYLDLSSYRGIGDGGDLAPKDDLDLTVEGKKNIPRFFQFSYLIKNGRLIDWWIDWLTFDRFIYSSFVLLFV